MSLYNDIRPMSLNEVIGQETVTSAIRGILKNNNIPNTMLFIGVRGTGKTTIARIVAKMLNCEEPSDDGPCMECKSCKDISAGGSLDVIEIDAASNNGVDNIRSLIEDSKYSPIGKYKVYIIDEVHMLSTGAFNALLKTLEEPPKNVLFILCTTEEHKIPLTILSRSAKFYFNKVTTDVIADYLLSVCEKYEVVAEKDACFAIAKAAGGSVRDSLSILEQVWSLGEVSLLNVKKTIDVSDDETSMAIITSVLNSDAVTALESMNKSLNNGKNISILLMGIIDMLTDATFIKSGSDHIEGTKEYQDAVNEIAQMATVSRLTQLASAFSELLLKIGRNEKNSYLVKAKILSLITDESRVTSLENKISELEEKCELLTNGLFDLGSNLETPTVVVEEKLEDEEKLILEDSPQVDTSQPLEDDFSPITEPSPFMEDDVPDFGTPLPGDISIAGADVVGTIKLFPTSEDNPSEESCLEESEETNTSEELEVTDNSSLEETDNAEEEFSFDNFFNVFSS